MIAEQRILSWKKNNRGINQQRMIGRYCSSRCKSSLYPPEYPGTVEKDLADEVKELNKRISELEKMLSVLLKPLTDVRKTTERYLKLAGLLLDHGGLTPDVILPELKDPISKDIVRVLLERPEQNVSQITDLVKSKRGTASRRIIRKKLTVS